MYGTIFSQTNTKSLRSMPARKEDSDNAVWLRIYDISNGKAATWSQLVLGRKIEGVWHTGVQVFGLEYFYGGGIDCMLPCHVESSFNMEIVEVQLLGYTTKGISEFQRFLYSLRNKFTPTTYDLVEWNCNHFSDACVRFLLNDRGIPEYILDLPETIRSSFIGDLILKFFKRLHHGQNPVYSIDNPDHPRFALNYSNRRRSCCSRQRSLSDGSYSSSDDTSTDTWEKQYSIIMPNAPLSDCKMQQPTYPLLLQHGRRGSSSSHTTFSPYRNRHSRQKKLDVFFLSCSSQAALLGQNAGSSFHIPSRSPQPSESLWKTPPPSPVLQCHLPFNLHPSSTAIPCNNPEIDTRQVQNEFNHQSRNTSFQAHSPTLTAASDPQQHLMRSTHYHQSPQSRQPLDPRHYFPRVLFHEPQKNREKFLSQQDISMLEPLNAIFGPTAAASRTSEAKSPKSNSCARVVSQLNCQSHHENIRSAQLLQLDIEMPHVFNVSRIRGAKPPEGPKVVSLTSQTIATTPSSQSTPSSAIASVTSIHPSHTNKEFGERYFIETSKQVTLVKHQNRTKGDQILSSPQPVSLLSQGIHLSIPNVDDDDVEYECLNASVRHDNSVAGCTQGSQSKEHMAIEITKHSVCSVDLPTLEELKPVVERSSQAKLLRWGPHTTNVSIASQPQEIPSIPILCSVLPSSGDDKLLSNSDMGSLQCQQSEIKSANRLVPPTVVTDSAAFTKNGTSSARSRLFPNGKYNTENQYQTPFSPRHLGQSGLQKSHMLVANTIGERRSSPHSSRTISLWNSENQSYSVYKCPKCDSINQSRSWVCAPCEFNSMASSFKLEKRLI